MLEPAVCFLQGMETQKGDQMRYLVTGGAGFIGSNFIRFLFNKYGDDAQVVNLDKLTYAGIRENLAEFEGKPNYRFQQGDIARPEDAAEAYRGVDGSGVDVVVNFAAETHVDRSLMEAGTFIETDVHGVLVLLEEARKHAPKLKKFIQISTDEVYGSIDEGSFTEMDPMNPRNPYSASKAGGDRMAFAYSQTYGMPVVITRASNNFGPYQYPEKLIPLFVTNAIDDVPLPLYGDGRNVRDWLWADDHCAAVDFLIDRGEPGEVYNVGGGNERENREVTQKILELVGKPPTLVRHVADRQGHDRRYSLDSSKLARLGFQASTDFDAALEKTVRWYVENQSWWRSIKEKSAEYKAYYAKQYETRG
jgi:dTDP-glucose 4,6-dehydratase